MTEVDEILNSLKTYNFSSNLAELKVSILEIYYSFDS